MNKMFIFVSKAIWILILNDRRKWVATYSLHFSSLSLKKKPRKSDKWISVRRKKMVKTSQSQRNFVHQQSVRNFALLKSLFIKLVWKTDFSKPKFSTGNKMISSILRNVQRKSKFGFVVSDSLILRERIKLKAKIFIENCFKYDH